jgi:copper/silver efflux system protein
MESAILKRISAPMVGGILTSIILDLLVNPAIYGIWRERSLTERSAELELAVPLDAGAG